MVETIINNFEIWAKAQTLKTKGRGIKADNQKLYGIFNLRELISELAVRGKLVPQNSNDKPAIKQFKIKEEPQFSCPPNWVLFHFGDFLKLEYGKSLSASQRENSGDVDVYGSNGIVGKHTQSLVNEPCIVIGRKGSAGALNKAVSPSWTTDVAYYLIPPAGFDLDFTYILLQSMKLDKIGKGIKPGLNRNEAYKIIAALPPLAEQQRIVAKVDELMALCDQLEQQQTDSNTAHEILVETLLDTLTNAAGQAELESAWERIASHFDILFTSEHSVDRLKQTILQLAVMGKLVPQNPGDEPASELLKKIGKEKARLVKEGIIRKDKLDIERSKIETNNLHKGWEFAYMQDITSLITCGIASTPKYFDQGRIFLSAKNVKPYKFMPEDHQYVDEETYRKIISWGAKPEKGDILLTRVGSGIGQAALIDQDIDFAYYVSLTLIKPIQPYINSQFLLLWINSPEGVNKALENIYGRGVSQGNLNVNQVRKFAIPVPPLAEQHRIVAKVDELFGICDALKERIREAQGIQMDLADAVVEGAIK